MASDLCDLLLKPTFLVLNAILDNSGQQDLELLKVVFRRWEKEGFDSRAINSQHTDLS